MAIGDAINGRTSLRRQIGQFFYADETPHALALVRIIVPWVIMCAMLPRWIHAREIYSSDGAATPLSIPYGYPELLPEFPGAVAVGLHTALLFFLVSMSLGWCARLSIAASFVIYTYLNLMDAVSTMTKYSVIASHVLLLLSLSHCGAIWSIDSWLRRRRARTGAPETASLQPRTFPAWPRRLMQILVGAIYFGAAITKMHTPSYFSGDQLQTWMITHVNFDHAVGEYLALYPPILVVFAYIAIVWEITFLFLAWRGWGRAIMLSIGIVFHLMTTLTLGLYIFPMVCITTYLSFINENDIRRWAQRLAPLTRRLEPVLRAPARAVSGLTLRLPPALRFPSPVVFAFAALAAVVGGIELEYRLDPYGERRPEGPYTLRELDADMVTATLLAPPKPLRQADKFVSLDVGSVLLGDLLADHRKTFKHGETAIVQCTMNPPHEDMWVECNLHNASGRIVSRTGQVVPRESLRGNFYYELTDSLEPGTYYFVLQADGNEVMRRHIEVEAGRPAQSAKAVAN